MVYLLGCDVGTGAAKSVVINEQGTVVASHFVEYSLHTPRPGIAEQDADDLWRAGAETMRVAIEQAGVRPDQIAGVGVSAHSPGVVLVDGDGQTLRPAITWMDRRATEQCRWIRETRRPGAHPGGHRQPGRRCLLRAGQAHVGARQRAGPVPSGREEPEPEGFRRHAAVGRGLHGPGQRRPERDRLRPRASDWEPTSCGDVGLERGKLPGCAALATTSWAAVTREAAALSG